MGLSKYFYNLITCMGLWFIGGFECNREEPLDDIKHSIYSHLKHPLTSHRHHSTIQITNSSQYHQHNSITAFTALQSL